MSRLTEKDIENVTVSLQKLDEDFLKITGKNMREISAFAVGNESLNFENLKVAVVPITSGLGIIGGFSQTVCEILKHIGVDAFVTEKTDVSGIYEAFQKANCVFYADDDTFIAVNHINGKISENSEATGLGFASALALASGDIKGKEVLVLGAGKVGLAAADFLHKKGAKIYIYDPNKDENDNLPYQKVQNPDGKRFSYIVEATPCKAVVNEKNASENAVITAPGVPFGVCPEFAKKISKSGNIIHNPLELGVAAMMAQIV